MAIEIKKPSKVGQIDGIGIFYRLQYQRNPLEGKIEELDCLAGILISFPNVDFGPALGEDSDFFSVG